MVIYFDCNFYKASLRPDIFEFSITQAGHVILPAVCETVYKNQRFEMGTSDMKFANDSTNRSEELVQEIYVDDDGLFNVHDGTFCFTGTKTEGLFHKINDEWDLNVDVLHSQISRGFPLKEANKIFHFQPTGNNCDLEILR